MLDNYEPVAVRLDRLLTYLRNLQTEPRIITHMVSAPGADICVFRAELWLGETLYATGWAEEIRGVGNVNKTSHLENCETSALGRMCEAYSPTANDWRKRPSREEMEKVFRADNSPPSTTGYKDHSNPPSTTTVRGPMTSEASEKQIGYIMGACKRDGIVPPAWVKTLSKQDASSFIEAHKNGEAISAILERLGSDEEPF
jgi:hypothetical protein